ncbi:unnamed protein product [Sympodiomycopsis kandeliae]
MQSALRQCSQCPPQGLRMQLVVRRYTTSSNRSQEGAGPSQLPPRPRQGYGGGRPPRKVSRLAERPSEPTESSHDSSSSSSSSSSSPRKYNPYIFKGWQNMYHSARTFKYSDSPFRAIPKWQLGLAVAGIGGFWAVIFFLPSGLRQDLHRQRLGISDKEVMGPTRWTAVGLLKSIKTISPSTPEDVGDGNHKLMTLRIPEVYLSGRNEADPAFATDRLTISSLSVKQPDIQIERSYSPLQSASEARDAHQADFLIKRYGNGEMGRYLHSKQPGRDQIEIRGWQQTWDEKWMQSAKNGPLEEVVMIVGGTGIAPAYQLINSTLKKQSSEVLEDSGPRFRLLYAAPSPSSFLLLPELKQLQESHPERLQIGLWVERDESPAADGIGLGRMLGLGGQRSIGGLKALTGRIGEKDLNQSLGPIAYDGQHRRAILVCGPEPMVQAIAGPRAIDGRSQGPLGGILGKIPGVERGEVWKL